MERPWMWKENSFDFIFSRDLLLAIRDFPKLIDQCYTSVPTPHTSLSQPTNLPSHLKPGGYIEFQAITACLGSDDNTLPLDGSFQKFADNLNHSAIIFGTPIDDPLRWKGWFEERGFVDVTVKVVKLPCNTWPKDPRMKVLGAWEMENLLSNLEGMTMRLFQKALGWTPEEVAVFLVGVRKEIRDRSIHAYWP
jgi:hypothetical protein